MSPATGNVKIELIYPDLNAVRNDVAWYKWEFLRRNKIYRSDYNKFQRLFGAWFSRKGYWFDRGLRKKWTASDERYFYDRIAPFMFKMCRKWKIGRLLDPRLKFDKRVGTHRLLGSEIEIPTAIEPGLFWDPKSTSALAKLGFSGTADHARRYGDVLLVEFNLNWPMKDLTDYAKRALGYAQENYRNELKKRGVKIPNSRRRLEAYDAHLHIWDLKQDNQSLSKIAKIVFPNDFPESALRKVQDHLKAAQRLISGHYTEIR